MVSRGLTVGVTVFLLLSMTVFGYASSASRTASSSSSLSSSSTTTADTGANLLSSHWVPGWGYRDELTTSDVDYQNFWTDNAGKILSMAVTTGNATETSHALSFLESLGLGSSSSYYLPEVRVNSSVLELQNDAMVTNRIVQLVKNTTSSGLQSLAIGDYYAGSKTVGYLGSDRIFVSGSIYRSTSSSVSPISGGFSKRSLFETGDGDFYLYVNATLAAGKPYASVSIQVLPLSSPLSSSDILYLQVFSSSGQFDNASLYGSDGSFLRQLAYNSGSPSAQKGLIIPYSERFSALAQDSVAVSFNNSTATVNDFEHWYQDSAFDDLSWVGIAYDAPANSVGVLSQPIYSDVYPLQHLDYRLVNDTAKYIASDPVGVAVSPPAGFGFVSYGLALDAASNPQNATLVSLARGYWNYYYDRYDPSGFSNAYSRSTNLLAMAGFSLYQCNSTVESFTREFVGGNPGASIEEYGWAAAALHQLYQCSGLQGDKVLYQHIVDAFVANSSTFLTINPKLPSEDYLFQFGETASGLLLGGVSFNNPIVLDAMNAVYQSNVSGKILAQPYRGDLANTEGLPAYMLSTFLFQQEMEAATGYRISSLQGCNLTLILYSNDLLVLDANGSSGGSVTLIGPNGPATYPADKPDSVIPVVVPPTTITTTITSTTTTTARITSTVTSTSTTTTTSTVNGNFSTTTVAETLAVGVALGLAAATGYFVRRRKK
jgi:hypothetical protein